MLKNTFSLLLLSFMLVATTQAADKTLDSAIAQVTVYTDRAEVTRLASTELESGIHVLSFENLPSRLENNSVRVDGRGAFILQDIKIETEYVDEVPHERLAALKAELLEREYEHKEAQAHSKRLKKAEAMLEQIFNKLTATGGEEAVAPEMNPEKWAQMLEFQMTQREELDYEQIDTERRIKELNEEIAKLHRQINELGANRGKQIQVARVTVEATKAGSVELELSYLVYGPSWYPSYDIRVDRDARKVGFIYYGNVQQSTGEDWSGVALRLSTAQPMIGGNQPELSPWYLRKYEPMAKRDRATPASPQDYNMRNTMLQMVATDAVSAMPAAEMEEMEVRQATVESGATAAVFVIPAESDIPSNNQSSKVTIARETFDAYFRYSAVPKLSPHVYLKARIRNATDYVFLPGQSSIFLDNAFVSNAYLDLVQPDEAFWTWLGIDQGIKVERKLLSQRSEEEGMFSKDSRIEYKYQFNITNNKKSAEELVLWDQLPISNHEDIVVELIEPDYKEGMRDLKMNEHKYLEWRFNLEAGEERTVPFEFVIEHPREMEISGL